jgi:hypothetical protein
MFDLIERNRAMSTRRLGTVVLSIVVHALIVVEQWRYSPLMLNGKATPFIVTVTVTFNLR